MTRNRSIIGRLKFGFVIIALVGSVLVMAVEFLNFELLLGAGRERIGAAAMVHEVTEHVLIPAVLILLPLFVATLWVLKTSLAPLEVAAARIHAASESERGFRIEGEDMPLEVVPFIDAINNLLRRLDETATRLEAFAADAAHELRTPLTILALELGRMDGHDATRLRHDVMAMSRLVEKLLLIAQLDAARAAPIPVEEVRLDAAAQAAVTQMATVASASGKTLDLEVNGEATIRGQGEIVQTAIRNLIENGLRATGPDETVTVLVGPGAQVRVRDGGEGVSREKLGALAQRFVRADRKGDGVGLGLAIVSSIMALHGGTLDSDPEKREIIMRFD